MMAVIFEVTPHAGQASRYFDAAAALRDQLGQIDGFISIERFESLTRPGTFLSLSYWQDEAAVARWRNHSPHRATQRAGRDSIFEHYGIRVANVVRDYGMLQRADAPADSNAAFRECATSADPSAAFSARVASAKDSAAFPRCAPSAGIDAPLP